LYRAKDKSEEDRLFEIIGVGIWHRDDTDALAAMLDPSNLEEQTPH